MSPVRRKARARLMNDISKALVNNLNQKQKIVKLKKLGEIALENQKLLNAPYPMFVYMKKRYTYPYNLEIPRYVRDLPRTLHVSLIEQVDNILKVSFEEQTNHTHLMNLINNCIGMSPTIRCLRRLLPAELWCYYDQPINQIAELFDIADPLTDEQVEQFKEENITGYNAIKILCMKELLLGV